MDDGDLPSNSVTALAAGHDVRLGSAPGAGLPDTMNTASAPIRERMDWQAIWSRHYLVDHAGVLWIVAGGNLSRFDGSTFRNFMRERDVPMNSIRAVTEDRDHNIYLSGNSSVVKLTGGNFVDVFEPSALRTDFPQGCRSTEMAFYG
jgi:hypothetical protein